MVSLRVGVMFTLMFYSSTYLLFDDIKYIIHTDLTKSTLNDENIFVLQQHCRRDDEYIIMYFHCMYAS